MGSLDSHGGMMPIPLTVSAGAVTPATASGNYGPASYAFDRNTPVPAGADLVEAYNTFGLQVNLAATVAPTAFTAQLQGSLDGLGWYNLGTALNSTTAPVQYVAVADSPARYIRVALTITGGTNVQATAWVGVSE